MIEGASSVAWAAAAGRSRDWIASRIPHQGEMCLLEYVVSASPQELVCTTESHLLPDHPMRHEGELGAACGVEYAAQAMALHGALVAEQRGAERSKMGFLVSVRAVSLHVSRLDNLAGEIRVSVACEADNGDHCVYTFNLTASGRPLLDGRAMVILNAPSFTS